MTFCQNNNLVPAKQISYSSNNAGGRLATYTMAPAVESGYPLYSDDGNNRTGWYLVCPKETYNLVPNPTFFLGLDNWSSFNASMIRTNSNSFDSGFSALIRGSGDVVTAERRAYIESEILGWEEGNTYTFSMYLWLPEIYDTEDDLIGTISIVDSIDGGVTFEEVISSRVTKFQRWVRVGITKTIRPGATNVWVRVNLRSQDQQEVTPPHNPTGFFNLKSEYMYADFAQFEIGGQATTPFHGSTRTGATIDRDLGGYRWLGVDHNSVSFRSDCTRDGGELKSFSELDFEVLEHTGHGAPPVRDIFFDYSNRPGGEYQKTAVDTNVLTFTGFTCGSGIADLECKIFGLKTKMMPNIADCVGKFLLVYIHDDCNSNLCDPERYVAYVVTYIGGFEGQRNNLHQQRMTLQFRAHDAFPFEWPGRTGHALNYQTIVQGQGVTKIGIDSIDGFPLPDGEYRTIACMAEENKFLVGGSGLSEESGDIYLYDCNSESDCAIPFSGGVNTSLTDSQGNVILGGSFTAPFNRVAIFYPASNGWGDMGYTGGDDVLSLAAPFWGEIVVGTANSVHIITATDSFVYATDGPVNALLIDGVGNVYAFGDFTTIDGVAASNIAIFRVNADGCLDIANGSWESLGFSLDGSINSADIKNDLIVFGGNFTESTPDPVPLCEINEGRNRESKGANQSVLFQDLGGGIMRLEFQLTSAVMQAHAAVIAQTGQNRMMRILAKSTLGTTYSFLIDSDSIVATDFVTNTVGTTNLYTVRMDLDTTHLIGGVCDDLNPSIQEEIESSFAFMAVYANTPYPAGGGLDDSLNSVSIQQLFRIEDFTGDATTLNNIASLSGEKISPLGDGLPNEVNKVFINPDTGEILAGTVAGLFVWSGREWQEYPADLGQDSSVLDIAYCNGNLYLLYESTSIAILPGQTNIDYNGTAEKIDFDLVIHGPGKVFTFEHGLQKKMKFCTQLQCNEIATLNFGNGNFTSPNRNLSPTLLSGSRYDFSLNGCDNPIKLLITDTEATTKATILYNRCHWGIEAICCADSNRPTTVGDGTAGGDDGLNTLCCPMFHVDSRDPTDDDCSVEGFEEGDKWLSYEGNCASLFINTGGECCDDLTGTYTGSTSGYYTDEAENTFCLDDGEE